MRHFSAVIDEDLGLSVFLEGQFNIIGTPQYAPQDFQFESQNKKKIVIGFEKDNRKIILSDQKWSSFLNYGLTKDQAARSRKIHIQDYRRETPDFALFDMLQKDLNRIASIFKESLEESREQFKIKSNLIITNYILPILDTGEFLYFFEKSDYGCLNSCFKTIKEKEFKELPFKMQIVNGILNIEDGCYYSKQGESLIEDLFIPLEESGAEEREYCSLEKTFLV